MSAATEDKHPESTAALVASLKALRHSNVKACRPTVHLYPPSVYAPDDKGEGSSTHRERRITSWKMTEHMYKSSSNQFPTLARGLFIEEVEEGDPLPDGALECEGDWNGEPRERIVARGYDKFFNTGEVAWTEWDAIKAHTLPPYQLTLKSNGCLILISALDPRHLVVASKHSLGTRTEDKTGDKTEAKKEEAAEGQSGAAELAEWVQGIDISGQPSTKAQKKEEQKQQAKEVKKQTEKEEREKREKEAREDKEDQKQAQAHAEVGRRWVRRTLERSEKTEADLAKRLWDTNSTAVLELCDDDFEEHVIATPEYWTGLHLHGLNHNTPHFSTASPAEVAALAKEFGFIPTKYVELNTVDEVKSFTDDVAKTGSWEGDMIEGFVVRSTVAQATGPGKPPYRPGAPFFFKVKFDEPYLLYRQWREVTRAMLPLLQSPDQKKTAEIWKSVAKKNRRPEVAVYADWAGQAMKTDPNLFDDYDRGVVRVRERFLEWTEKQGAKDWQLAKEGKYKLKGDKVLQAPPPAVDRSNLPKKYVVVPVAVPGCGKTLIGVALGRLFGFGHTQSDDITSKKTAPTFLKNIVDLLKSKSVVYADRNNHIDKHYDELTGLVDNSTHKKALKDTNLGFIGIVWDVESQPYHRMLRVCSERVVKRGDNHQTLRPDLTAEAEHEAVVGSFLRRWTAPLPEQFEKLITVQVEQTPKETLKQIVDQLVPVLNLSSPSDSELDEALRAADEYKPATPYHAPALRVGKPIRYFGVAPEIDLPATVSSILSTHNEASAQALFDHLKTNGRLTPNPHITLAHNATVKSEKEAAGGDDTTTTTTTGPIETLWNTCKELSEMPSSPLYHFDISLLVWDDRVMALGLDHIRPRETANAPEVVVPDSIALYLHVTVGTRDEKISAFEARGIVKVAREAIASGNVAGLADEAVEGGGKVRWVRVEGVSSQGRIRGMF